MRFHSGEIAVQERAQVRDTAEDVGESIRTHLVQASKEFLERRQMVVLGSVDHEGHVWASVVTGERGFIRVADQRTVMISARPSASDPLFDNLKTERHVALFAPDFLSAQRIRINGLGSNRGGRNPHPDAGSLRKLPALYARANISRASRNRADKRAPSHGVQHSQLCSRSRSPAPTRSSLRLTIRNRGRMSRTKAANRASCA